MGMNSMFSNFNNTTNLDTTYQPNPFQQSFTTQQNSNIQSVNINKPYEILNADKTLKGYFWYYGNSVDLQFDVEGEVTLLSQDEYMTLEDILANININANIYNFRMEPILEFSNSINAKHLLKVDVINKTILMQIDNLISKDLVKGKYYISLEATHPSGYHETLFNADSCVFEVR